MFYKTLKINLMFVFMLFTKAICNEDPDIR